jgi:hypothetical protein
MFLYVLLTWVVPVGDMKVNLWFYAEII